MEVYLSKDVSEVETFPSGCILSPYGKNLLPGLIIFEEAEKCIPYG